MLTQQHRFAQQILHPHHRHDYRLHMCGLCHALGDHYGLVSRWLTSYDLILLNLLTNAQQTDDPTEILRHCPLNPRLKVRTNQDIASTFAAHIAVILTHISLADDVQDSGSWLSRLATWLIQKPNQQALNALEKLGFETATFTEISRAQNHAETDSTSDPARPTALTSAAIFRMTAALAHLPSNEAPLAAIGTYYGAYLYWMDAYRDFPRDMVAGDFNPLRPYVVQEGDSFSLSEAGLKYLKGHFERFLAGIESELAHLTLYRYQPNVADMLTDPLRRAIHTVKTHLKKPPVQYQPWQWSDALKAALFLLPITATYDSGKTPDELPLIELSPEELERQKNAARYNNGLACGYLDCSPAGQGLCDCLHCASFGCQDADRDFNLDCVDSDCGTGCESCDVGGCDLNCN